MRTISVSLIVDLIFEASSGAAQAGLAVLVVGEVGEEEDEDGLVGEVGRGLVAGSEEDGRPGGRVVGKVGGPLEAQEDGEGEEVNRQSAAEDFGEAAGFPVVEEALDLTGVMKSAGSVHRAVRGPDEADEGPGPAVLRAEDVAEAAQLDTAFSETGKP